MESPGLDERLVQGLRTLKTQRMAPTIGPSYLILDSTPGTRESSPPIVPLPSWLGTWLGGRERENTPSALSPLCWGLLVLSALIGAIYPVGLQALPGGVLFRLFMRSFLLALSLFPVVIAELSHRHTREIFSLWEALSKKSIWHIYRNSLYLTGWGVGFAYAMGSTNKAPALFFSNLSLAFWVGRKILRKNPGVSEIELNGLGILVIGAGGYFCWLLLTGGGHKSSTDTNQEQDSSLHVPHFLLSPIAALLASLCHGLFFTSNYDLTFYLPSYTSLLWLTLCTLGNLELIHLLINTLSVTGEIAYSPLIFQCLTHLSTPSEMVSSLFSLALSLSLLALYALQHWLAKKVDPLLVVLSSQSEPLLSLLYGVGIGLWGGWSLLPCLPLFALFLVLPNILVALGIRQLEERFEGGIIGLGREDRNRERFEHLRELRSLGVDQSSQGSL